MSRATRYALLAVVALAPIACAGGGTAPAGGPTLARGCTAVEGVEPAPLQSILARPAAGVALRGQLPDTLLLALAYDSTGTLSEILLYARRGVQFDASAITAELRRHVREEGPPSSHVQALLAPGEPIEVLPYRRSLECPPRMENTAEISRLLRAMSARTGASDRGAVVWAAIDAEGRVIQAEVNRSAGNFQIDREMLEIARQARFVPAMVDGFAVPVWVALPLGVTTPPETPSRSCPYSAVGARTC